MRIRVSIGTLAKMRILNTKMYIEPTTAYILQYSEHGCLASCAFCAQSHRNSIPKDYLSRVIWPVVDLDKVLNALKHSRFSRVCIETVLKMGFLEELVEIVKEIRKATSIPISTAVVPIPSDKLRRLQHEGVDMLGVGLDVATPQIFERVAKPYTWSTYIKFIERSVEIFGRNNVVVHLIIGLGESISDAVKILKKIYTLGAKVALFRYVPLHHIKKSSHDWQDYSEVYRYRVIQLVNKMLEYGYDIEQYLEFEDNRVKQLKRMPKDIDVTEVVLTSGCPGCNRPFYNESPRGPIFNYPSRDLAKRDEMKIVNEFRAFGIEL